MNRRELLQKSRIGALVIVLLLVGSPTQAADSVSSVTVLIAYHFNVLRDHCPNVFRRS
jgi:hypothetical protein